MVDKHIQSQGMVSMENKAVQIMLERIRGNRPEISDDVRKEIYEVNASAAKLKVSVRKDEPDLNSPITDGYRTTWGEKKALCELEARYAHERGAAINHNPYHENTWSNKWWADCFAQCVESLELGVVSAITEKQEGAGSEIF